MAIIIPPGSFGAGGASGGGGAGAAGVNAVSPIKSEDDRLFDMLCSRMRWYEYDPYRLLPANAPPFQRISAHRLNEDTVVVFVIQNGKALTIEDGADLFPSDALVTQLRLIAEPK